MSLGRKRFRRARMVPVALLGLLSAVVLTIPAVAGPSFEGSHDGEDGPIVIEADPFTLSAPGLGPGQIEMTTVSTRPSLVSGGDVRVEVRGLDASDHLSVYRDGTDVSHGFEVDPRRPSVRTGLVTGLREGPNRLVAVVTGPSGTMRVRLTVRNHPIAGPVLSGPHQRPFICETEESGMGPPLDDDCFASATFHWYARTNAGEFRRLDDPYAPYPPDTAVAQAGGRTTPFVVRVESAVINRSITRIAVLDDPHHRGSHAPFRPELWNRRLLFQFGESCGTGYHQGRSSEDSVFAAPTSASAENLAGPFLDLAGHLGQGWMVANSTLTTFGVHCNDVLSAETFAMVKEHIVDTYGRIDHTIGAGASGGAIQQYAIANGYPGLLDAITPLLSFPDVVTTAMTVFDCLVLVPVFDADPLRWTEAKQQAVTGLATSRVCRDWIDLFGKNLKPTSCDGSIPPSERYHPVTNRSGARCSVQDSQRNIWGLDGETGFARRPVGNAGVQYGLRALNAGLITPDDFIVLNRAVGGFDIDGNPVPERNSIDPEVAAIAYDTGRVTGRGALDLVPIIDQTIPVVDFVPVADIHDQVRPLQVRARLDATYGRHGNLSIWSGLPLPANAVDVADAWLDALDAAMAADPTLSRAEAVVRSRPATAGDQCRAGVAGVPLACDNGVAAHSTPRLQAGGPLAEDNIACARRPVDPHDYPVVVRSSPALVAAIRAIFPEGVCDWSRPPIGGVGRSRTWLSFGDGPRFFPAVTVGHPLVRSAPLTGVAGAGGELPATGTGPWGGAGWALALAGALVLFAVRRWGGR